MARETAELILISFLALFLELALIRWIPGCIKFIGYYTNLVLISSVLGIGLGCAAPGEEEDGKNYLLALPVRLLISLAIYAVSQRIDLSYVPDFWGERVWQGSTTGIITRSDLT